jgi:adenylate kinase
MRLLLIGPPGGGKGTQAKYLIDHFYIPQISTGDMLRANIHNNTNLGKDAQKFMNSGQLVPDSIILDMMKERLTDQDCVYTHKRADLVAFIGIGGFKVSDLYIS